MENYSTTFPSLQEPLDTPASSSPGHVRIAPRNLVLSMEVGPAIAIPDGMCDFPSSVELSPSLDGDLAEGASLRHASSSEEVGIEEISDSALKHVDGGLEVAFLGDSGLPPADDSEIRCSALRSLTWGLGWTNVGWDRLWEGFWATLQILYYDLTHSRSSSTIIAPGFSLQTKSPPADITPTCMTRNA
ncbi:hypothetical protein Dimus_022240 [Dionaea muscipula]